MPSRSIDLTECRLPAMPASVDVLEGARVRVVSRAGRSVVGRCRSVWPLRAGGLGLSVAAEDGSGLHHLSTQDPVELLDQRPSDASRPGAAPRAAPDPDRGRQAFLNTRM